MINGLCESHKSQTRSSTSLTKEVINRTVGPRVVRVLGLTDLAFDGGSVT